MRRSGSISRIAPSRRRRRTKIRASGKRASACGDAQADDPGVGGHRVGAELERAVTRLDAGGGAAHAEALLEREGLGLEVDAEEARPEHAAEPDHADGAEDVADRVGDRDVGDHPVAVGVGEAEGAERLGGGAHRRALGQAAGEKARGIAGIEAEDVGHDDHRPEAGHGADHRQEQRLHPALAQRLQELRADGIADAEEEEEEEEGLGHRRDRDVRELADGEAGQQRSRDRPEGELAELHAADEVAERDGQEHRKLGILLEEAGEPVHVGSSRCGPAPRLRSAAARSPGPRASAACC